MNHAVHNKLISFIWSIADDCLRDVYVRGKYRDVILPMVVLRRLDTLLEESKEAVLEEVDFQKNEMKFTEFDPAGLTKASGYVFYNTSKWTLRSIYDTATNNQQILLQNFEEYLNGFSDNVKEIVAKFDLRAKIRHMAAKDVLLDVLEKFVSPYINLTPYEREDPDGYKLPALSNLGMGYVFEELIRKFNEENNEEAGEHFTPREVIQLMTHLIFDPIKDKLPPVMTIYDPACGSGGMLTEAQNFIKDEEGAIKALGDVYLYGKEINDETYAICKSDMMIKGNDPSNIKSGSTLATDEFAGKRFDFMLSNPPYGKSWSSDLKYIKDGKDVIDARFQVRLKDYWGNEEVVDATPWAKDGQLLFLMEMISKMKPANAGSVGSRIASVHNGSSLFTGDAGQGESNIRRHIIENDMLEAIIQLPTNLFYNTSISTYIWVLCNNKSERRKGHVQLIDASRLYGRLSRNLGEKNCEFRQSDIKQIADAFLDVFEGSRGEVGGRLISKIFKNEDFGHHKVIIERPDRRKAQLRSDLIESLRYDKSVRLPMEWAYSEFGDALYEKGGLKEHEKAILKWCEDQEITLSAKNRAKLLKLDTWKTQAALIEVANALKSDIGGEEFSDFNEFQARIDQALKAHRIKLSTGGKNAILGAVSWYDEAAAKVIKRKLKLSRDKLASILERWGCEESDLPDFGYYPTTVPGEFIIYEPCTDLRDSENIPLHTKIHDYFRAEIKPSFEEAWVDLESVKIGYDISFNKHFYEHTPLRRPEKIGAEIVGLEKESEGLISEILGLNEKAAGDVEATILRGINTEAPMKYSGEEWLGDVPAHWEMTKLGVLLKPVSVKNRPDLPLLSITRERGVIVRDIEDQDSNHNFIPDDLSGYKVIRKGQFGMNKMKAWQGSYGVSEYDGIVSPAYYIFDFNAPIFPKYFHLAIRSKLYVSFFAAASDGVRIGQWDLVKSRMKNIPFLIPPMDEQVAIVQYLERQSKLLEKVIYELNATIDRLSEYRSSIAGYTVSGHVDVSGD